MLGGCVSEDLEGAEMLRTDDAAGPFVAVDGPSEVSVLPNGSVNLRVRYHDPSGVIAGIQVDFALSGAPQGASLAPTRVVTDGAGIAETKLQVGSMPGTIKVRAAAGEVADAITMTVIIREALDVALSVGVAYAGVREMSSYTVTAVDGMRCDQAVAAGIAGTVVYRFAELKRKVAFVLPADLQTALLAWGRDERGGELARGCLDFRAPITATSEEAKADLTITLTDTAMELDDTLSIALAVDAASAVAQLPQVVDQAVTRALGAGAHAGATFYLDAIAHRLNRPSADFAAFSGGLATQLSARDAGPEPLGQRMGELLQSRGGSIELLASYQPDEGASTHSVRALSSDGAQALDLAISPALTVTDSFDPARATLSFEPLRVELALGAYGAAVLAAMRSDTADEVASQLDEAAGCSVVAPWAQTQGICDAATASAACKDAVKELYGAVDDALEALPVAPITLTGDVATRDRSEDGAVDDLGPDTLAGTWGEAQVTSDLRVQAQTGLTR